MWPFKTKENKEFKVGDLIKCIDDRGWNLASQSFNIEYGKTYKLVGIMTCPDCGTVSYDIGCRFKDETAFTTCTPTNHRLPGAGIHWAGRFRFVKSTEALIENTKELELELEKTLQFEDYEKAALIRDKLKDLV